MRSIRIIFTAIAVCTAFAALASTASASKSQLPVIEDPARLLSGDVNVQNASLDEAQALGGKILKIPVLWRSIAPDGTSTVKPGGDLSDPAAYPAGSWDVLDRAVAGGQARGMQVWLMITAPAPRWAVSRETTPLPGAYEPDVAEYKRFATAVGRRYSSVKMFSVWNEVNAGQFIQPQRKGSVIYSAIYYRKMYKAGYDGLVAAGQRSAKIFFGELLPSYGPTNQRGTQPLVWLRSFFCIDAKGKKLTGRAAKAQKCSGIKSIKTAGLSYHPYTAPSGPLAKPFKDSAGIGHLKRVELILDQASKTRRISGRKVKIYSSEFGFQSSPPDPNWTNIKKIPLFLNQSEYLSWVDPRVATYSQYLIVDDEDLGGFQSGLRFLDGTKKPGVYEAYQTPIMVFKGKGNRVTVWGGLRAKAPGAAMAEIQYKNGSSWTTITQFPVSSAVGYFNKAISVSGAQAKTYRVTWSGGTSRETKPIAPVKPRV